MTPTQAAALAAGATLGLAALAAGLPIWVGILGLAGGAVLTKGLIDKASA